MDGNGRWAKKRGLPRQAGHAAGAQVFRKITKYCEKIGIQYLTAVSYTHLDVYKRQLMDQMAARPFIIQEFVSASAGRDIRLYMAGGKLIAAMRRTSTSDFRANIGNGGRAEAYAPSNEEIQLAERCCGLLGLDFAGVDLLHDAEGRPLVCEVNSNAHMAALTACSGVDAVSYTHLSKGGGKHHSLH